MSMLAPDCRLACQGLLALPRCPVYTSHTLSLSSRVSTLPSAKAHNVRAQETPFNCVSPLSKMWSLPSYGLYSSNTWTFLSSLSLLIKFKLLPVGGEGRTPRKEQWRKVFQQFSWTLCRVEFHHLYGYQGHQRRREEEFF